MLNLQKNNYNQLYLKANRMSSHILANKQRIQAYLRESNLNLATFQKLEECFLKCDKNGTGQITSKQFIIKMAKNNVKIEQHLLNNLLADIALN